MVPTASDPSISAGPSADGSDAEHKGTEVLRRSSTHGHAKMEADRYGLVTSRERFGRGVEALLAGRWLAR
jgi:hypothetical protein